MAINEESITTYEAAKILGMYHSNVRWNIQRGHLPAQRFGKVYVLSKASVEAFKVSRERNAR
jgi:excisionase family DNA binding protein